ncbi:C40 family peptidase [Enterococcus sp. DIV1271a]|nr:NlpC/P60 family protein [Enterococcus sp. DIV1271a]MBO1300682.1 C40 family peptidase [Enterococcus sp. DIV1271a]
MLVLIGSIFLKGNITHAEESVLSNRDFSYEKEQALEAGFSEEQFKQIMYMPALPSEEIVYAPFATMTTNQTKVVNKAKEQLGKPYVWGASGPNSFDCGGLVKYVYKQAVSMELSMGTTNQEKYGTEVSLNSLLPGDLLFYGDRGNTYHVGIYIGNGQMIHAPKPGETVTTVNIQYFYPSFARRLLSSEEPVVKKTFTEVKKTVMVNEEKKSIDSLPWGMKGYIYISSSTTYKGKVVTITQDSGSYAYSPELKGWIDKKGIDEVIATNVQGTIKNGGYSIDPVPWYSGIVHIGSTSNHINEKVTVTAKKGSYYYVANLGWIDKKAFNSELQKAVDDTPSTNVITTNKRISTEINKKASVLGNGKSIDTLPWGMPGYVKVGSLNNYIGNNISLTQEEGSYVYSPELKGWIDKKGLSIQ